jgi:hypothetical protein
MKFSSETSLASAWAGERLRSGTVETGMMAAVVDFFPTPVVISMGLMVLGGLLMFLAWPIQKRISRYHQRIRDAEFASPRSIRISGWRYDTTLILFGLLLLVLGALMFILTFPWGDL